MSQNSLAWEPGDPPINLELAKWGSTIPLPRTLAIEKLAQWNAAFRARSTMTGLCELAQLHQLVE